MLKTGKSISHGGLSVENSANTCERNYGIIHIKNGKNSDRFGDENRSGCEGDFVREMFLS